MFARSHQKRKLGTCKLKLMFLHKIQTLIQILICYNGREEKAEEECTGVCFFSFYLLELPSLLLIFTLSKRIWSRSKTFAFSFFSWEGRQYKSKIHLVILLVVFFCKSQDVHILTCRSSLGLTLGQRLTLTAIISPQVFSNFFLHKIKTSVPDAVSELWKSVK